MCVLAWPECDILVTNIFPDGDNDKRVGGGRVCVCVWEGWDGFERDEIQCFDSCHHKDPATRLLTGNPSGFTHKQR